MSDQQCRFLFDNADIRGEFVQLEQSYQQVISNNDLPTVIQQLLGDFLSAVSLLAATLKFDGILTLQARGSGPLSMIMAECTHQQQVRAIARLNEEVDETTPLPNDLQALVGNDGILALIIDPDKGERYQGIVPLDAPNLAACLEHYFSQSEQIGTRIWLARNQQRCAGLLLQALPKSNVATEEENLDHWQTAVHLVSTVKAEELLELAPQTLVHRLLNEFPIRLLAATPVAFQCSCSRERSAQALSALGETEVMTMLAESPTIIIDCQFCHQRYQFDMDDLSELFPDNHPTLH
ncbi:Hsp33 family molecular chaperone HslO [Halioxenophilus sp. WMMB6]|uniref:Hsp33 family molecular chaperone HslO n=1 Tax=Halioxenophilus sp. WMMB6 TaxID=3073815 RepID=UPI00295E394B|nr:Hsp33 family molecular chaperone HslO [Halioxenophilus sp. WMMB6]